MQVSRKIGLSLVIVIVIILIVIVAKGILGGPTPVGGNIVTFMGGKGKQYCGVDRTNTSIQCNFAGSSDDTTQFLIEDLNDGTFALKNMYTGQYCSDRGDKIECNKDVIGAWEKFHWIDQGNSTFSLTGPKSGVKRHFCADEVTRVVCNREKAGAWEMFTLGSSTPLPPIIIKTADTVTVTDTDTVTVTDTVTDTDTVTNEVMDNDSSSSSYSADSDSDSQSLWQQFLQFLFSLINKEESK